MAIVDRPRLRRRLPLTSSEIFCWGVLPCDTVGVSEDKGTCESGVSWPTGLGCVSTVQRSEGSADEYSEDITLTGDYFTWLPVKEG